MNVLWTDRTLKQSVVEGALATVMGTLLGGVFLTGMALHLGATRLQIGILAAIPALAHLAQLGAAFLVGRSGRSRQLCLRMAWASRLMWFPAIMVPLVLHDYSGVTQTWYVIAFMAISSILASVGGMAWLAWVKRLVPRERRIEFFSRRNVFNTGLAFSMSVAGGLLLDAWGYLLPGSPGGFVTVFAIAMGCGLVGAWILGKIPEPELIDHQPEPFWTSIRQPLEHPNFRRLLTFYAAWNLANHLATPFFAVYMLQILKLPFWAVTLLATVSSVSGLLMNGFWTKLKQNFGIRPVVLLATLGDAFIPLSWLLVGPETLWLIVPIHCFGIFSAPIAMGPNNLLLKIAPDRNASSYLALFNALTGPVTAIGAILGGSLAGMMQGRWQIGPAELTGLQLLFAISGLGRLASLGLLYRVSEPDADPVSRVFRILTRAGRYRILKGRRGTAPEPALQVTALPTPPQPPRFKQTAA